MAIREILKYPHPTLKKRCEKVDCIDDNLRTLIQDMIETMYSSNGIGLAACQVGVPRRVVVLDVSPMDPEKSVFVLINPEVTGGEGEVDFEEGCLSVPECTEKIKRQAKVCVKGRSPEGKEIEVTGEGILAVALQHEIDHLDGILILDRISRLKRELYRNKLKKEKKKEETP
jgi:peptide deformylase